MSHSSTASLSQYSYLLNYNNNDNIDLEYSSNCIRIKILDCYDSCYYYADVKPNDIKLDNLENFYQLVTNCIGKKPGYTGEIINNYNDTIDLKLSCTTGSTNITEKITLIKYEMSEIQFIQYEMRMLTKQVKKMSGTIDLLKKQMDEKQIKLELLEK